MIPRFSRRLSRSHCLATSTFLLGALVACDTALEDANQEDAALEGARLESSAAETALRQDAVLYQNEVLTALELQPQDEASCEADLAFFREQAALDPQHKVSLDLTQTLDYRFVLCRLQSRGMSAQTQPLFYKRLKAMHEGKIPRAHDITRWETLAGASSTVDMGTSTCNTVARSTQTPVTDSTGNTISSTFSMWSEASCAGGAEWAYLDSSVSKYPVSANYNLTMVGYESSEKYSWVDNSLVTLNSTTPITQNINAQYGLLQDAMSSFVLPDGSYEYQYVYEPLYSPVARLQMTSPTDTNKDGKTVVCLNRGSSSCDLSYSYNTSSGYMAIPAMGRVTYSVSGDANARLQSLTELRADVFLGSSGTPCTTLVKGTIPLTLSSDGKSGTFSWNPLPFASACAKESNTVRLNFKGVVQGSAGTALVDGPADSSAGYPLSFVWSCLKPDSLIRLADGRQIRIQELAEQHARGETVLVPGRDGRLMHVAALVEGPSDALIRLETVDGRVLEASLNHPIATADGFLQAQDLRAGDAVLMEEGLVLLKSATLEDYEGLTYNLALRGASAPVSSSQNLFTANGFQVGDFNLQLTLEDERPRALRWR